MPNEEQMLGMKLVRDLGVHPRIAKGLLPETLESVGRQFLSVEKSFGYEQALKQAREALQDFVTQLSVH